MNNHHISLRDLGIAILTPVCNVYYAGVFPVSSQIKNSLHHTMK